MIDGFATDDDRIDLPLFTFASGFAFGVATAFAVLAVAGSALETGRVTVDGFLGSTAAVNLAAAALFCLVVGAGLFLLAYRDNRAPVERAVGGDGDATDDAVETDAAGTDDALEADADA